MKQKIHAPISLVLVACLFVGTLGFATERARADAFFECIPDEVTEFSNRIHVRCENSIATPAGNVIRYVAIAKTDAALAQRFLTLANAALLSGRFFLVLIPDSATGNVSGCGSSDCRTPPTFGIRSRP